MVTRHARGQPNRKMFVPCPRSHLRIYSREKGSDVSSRVSPLILHTQAESGAYSRDSSHYSRQHPYKRSTAIGSVPSSRVTPLRTDDAHDRESASTGPLVLKVV